MTDAELDRIGEEWLGDEDMRSVIAEVRRLRALRAAEYVFHVTPDRQATRELIAALDAERAAHEGTRREHHAAVARQNSNATTAISAGQMYETERARAEKAERELSAERAAREDEAAGRSCVVCDRLRVERDEALAALSALREAAEDTSECLDRLYDKSDPDIYASWELAKAVAAAPATLAAQHDARVRAEALREAADAYCISQADGGGDWATVRAWLRTRANEAQTKETK